MGTHEGQKELFSYSVDLDRRVRTDHPLRRVLSAMSFTFARVEVAHTYGKNGHVSIDPVIVLKLMFLLFSENVRSERELMRRLPERLDWLWFLGYGLEDKVPDHSVLSKARARWGVALFEKLFIQTVRQCVEAGLVDGQKVHVDGSLIDADASRDSVIKADQQTIARIKAAYGAQERKLDQTVPASARYETNRHLVSTTDVDAPCVSKGPQSGTARPRYKHHRMVDDRCGVITAVATTPGDVPETEQVSPLLEQHETNTQSEVTTVVADRGYGTVDIYCALVESGVCPHMPPMQPTDHKSDGLFTKDQFKYDAQTNEYICPMGQRLKPRRFHKRREMTDYVAEKKLCSMSASRSMHQKQNRTIRGASLERILFRKSDWPVRAYLKRSETVDAGVISWKAASPKPQISITSKELAGAGSGASRSKTGSLPQCRISRCFAARSEQTAQPNCPKHHRSGQSEPRCSIALFFLPIRMIAA